MRTRTMLVVIAIAILGVLAISGTAAAMTWSHTSLLGNGYGYSGMMNGQQGYGYSGMMNGQQGYGYPGMMNGQQGYGYSGMMNGQQGYGYPGMMNGQQGYNGMMRGYQQGTPVTGVTSLTVQNYMYQPVNVQVPVGTTLTWTNQDNVPHSVTFKNGMKDSGLLAQGQSFSYTFTTPGTYQYYCTVHPYMVATVTVTK